MKRPLLMAGLAGATLMAAWLLLSPPPPAAQTPPGPAPVAPLALPQMPDVAAADSPPPQLPKPAASTSAAPQPAGRPIGPEGYGPHIEQALAGSDPQAAWEAVLWLRQCGSTESRREAAATLRNQGLAPEFMTQRMLEVDAEARRCQTVTAAHRALLAPLSARAMRAGIPEAAAAYAEAAFAADLSPGERAEVTEALRRDASSGHALSMMAAAMAAPAWGLGDDERLAYLFALAQLPRPMMTLDTATALVQRGQLKLSAPATPAQLAAARQAGQALVARISAAPRP